MLNDSAYLSQLLLRPAESLEVELKNWLNPTDKDDRAKIARELLALANHGGGYLIFGIDDKKLAPDPMRPASLANYSVDAINAIPNRFADPPFHCAVSLVPHPETGAEYPVIVVPGGHRVPIRCKRGHPQGHVIENAYYLRLPGPESGMARSSKDWEDLMRRCVFNSKDDFLNAIRAIISGPAQPSSKIDWSADLNSWAIESLNAADARFDSDVGCNISNYTLRSWWSIAYKVISPNSQVRSVESVTVATETSPGRRLYPPWDLAKSGQAHRKFDTDKTVEWLFFETYDHWNPAWTAYLRASSDLDFYLLGHFAEDVGESSVHPKPESVFYTFNAVEFFYTTLQHAAHVCKSLAIDEPQLIMTVTWSGLSGRKLGGFWDGPDSNLWQYLSIASHQTKRSDLNLTIGPHPLDSLESTFTEYLLEPVRTAFRAFEVVLDDDRAKSYISATLAKLRQNPKI